MWVSFAHARADERESWARRRVFAEIVLFTYDSLVRC